jgi:hypothetical protein
MSTVGERIAEKARAYAALELFRAFDEDRIPKERFSDFFQEQYVVARAFQDLIWATTDVPSGP